MRVVQLGGGAVAFEVEGQSDRVGSLDPHELHRRGWKQEVVENYLRYKQKQSAEAPGGPTPVRHESAT
jgi:hypothetical protein